MKVKKKLGTLVDYDSNKVFQVVMNAIEDARAVEGHTFDQRYDTIIASSVTDAVDDEVYSNYDDFVDHKDMQNIIYECLINAYETIAAREYMHYSDKKNARHSDAEDLEKAIAKVVNKDHDTLHENGNKDARKLPAQRDLIASQVFRTMGLKMYPEDIQQAHKDGLIHLHDLDMSPLLPYTNCCNVNLKDMLDNGFKIDEATIESPHSIGVATSITAQIIEAVSLSQLGGTSVPDIDMVLSPYAEKNYYKHLADAKDFDIKDKEGYAWKLTKRDIYQAMQGLEYSINSMHSNGAQVPFVTLSFGRGLDKYSKEIQKAMLNVRIKGLGHGVSAVFPKLVFTIDKGINLTPDDPNYDVKQLALYCSARRDYPDIVFGKNIKDITGGSYMTSMGCVSGEELVTYKGEDDRKHTLPISRLYETYSKDEKVQPNMVDKYIDLKGVQIKDSHTGEAKFVDCLRVIKNTNNKWIRLKFSNGRVLECTTDHPLEVIGKGRIQAKDLVAGDEITIAIDSDNGSQEAPFNDDYAWLLGDLICDGCLDKHSESLISYACEGENEIREAIGKVYESNPEMLRDWEHHRGKKGDYREVAVKDPALHDYAIKCFRGKNKDTRSLPDFIYTTPRHTRLAFMAGMIDADGYLNQHSQRIQIGSTSKALANGQMLLAESLGVHANMIINHYNNKGGVRYRVEFRIPQDLVEYIKCTKKRSKYNQNKRVNKSDKSVKLIDTEIIEGYDYSYDVTTASDYFDVSGVVSHNCRSFLPAWKNPKTGKYQISGRLNLGVVTLNTVRVALDSKNLYDFWKLLADRVELVHRALQFKISIVAKEKPEEAPILFEQGAIDRLKPGDSLMEKVFKHGRCTVSFGFIGLYETVAKFYGPNWEHNQEAIKFSQSIAQYIHDKCAEYYQEEDIYYSEYSTPSENLTGRFNDLNRKFYGDVPDITDKGYINNSFHYDVRKNETPFEKMSFEAPYQHISTGGFISYVEFPEIKNNLKALEKVWDYCYDIGIGYFGTNVPMDTCLNCGFQGKCLETNRGYKCPKCGETRRLQIVIRICGYLGSLNERDLNHGRMKEIEHRHYQDLGKVGVSAPEDIHVMPREQN